MRVFQKYIRGRQTVFESLSQFDITNMGISDLCIPEGRMDLSTADAGERERQRERNERRWNKATNRKTKIADDSSSDEGNVILMRTSEPVMKTRKRQRPVSSSESSSDEECEVLKKKSKNSNVVVLENTAELVANDGTRILAFEGGYCQLSNVRWATITEDDKEYNTVLQYVLAQLAMHFDSKKRLRQIMNARTAKEQVDAAKKIAGYGDDEWKKMEAKFMKRGLALKFQQHPKLLAALKGTGGSVIANCNSYDRDWATGTKLTEARTRDVKNWPGQNKLGILLMKIRDEN